MFRTAVVERTRLPSVKHDLYRILMKFGIGVLYKNLLKKIECCENRLSDGKMLLRVINEVLPVRSTFTDGFVSNSV